MPGWYTISLLIHFIALSLWLGGILFFLVVFGPAVHELRPGIAIRTLDRGRISLEGVSWAAIGFLLVTGIINLILRDQAASAPRGEFYTIILAIKLFLFFAML